MHEKIVCYKKNFSITKYDFLKILKNLTALQHNCETTSLRNAQNLTWIFYFIYANEVTTFLFASFCGLVDSELSSVLLKKDYVIFADC